MIIESKDPRDLRLANPAEEVFIEEPQEGHGTGITRVPNGLIYKFFELIEIENEEGDGGSVDIDYELKAATFVPVGPNFFRDYQQKNNVEQKHQENGKKDIEKTEKDNTKEASENGTGEK
jgi:hypothetical protein